MAHSKEVGLLSRLRARLFGSPEQRERSAQLRKADAEALAYHHGERDREENQESQPPSDEAIKICCLWVVEFYGPSQLQNLLDGFARLGWDKRKFDYRDSATEFVLKVRKENGTGAWMGLDAIYSPDYPRRSWMDGITWELPNGVEFAIPNLHQVMPSVTAVSLQFVFDDATAGCFQEILNETYETNMRKVGARARQYVTPPTQKAERIEEARQSLRSRCQYWFERNLPGVFCTASHPHSFPACEFVTLSKGLPFTDSEKPRHDYLEILGLDRTWDAWVCQDIPPIKLGWRTLRLWRDEYLLLAVNEGEVAAWGAQHPGSATDGRTLALSQLGLERWLVRWSLRALFSHYGSSVIALRDQALRASSTGVLSRSLRNTQNSLIKLRPDIVAVVEDIESLKEWGGLLRTSEHKCETLNPHGSTKELLQVVLDRVHDEAQRLAMAVRTITDDLLTSVNLRLQRAIAFYTLATLFLALVAAGFQVFGSCAGTPKNAAPDAPTRNGSR